VTDCVICQKHLGEGPLKGELNGMARLGHLIIESDRHVPYLADLNEAESRELGPLRTRLAHALRAALDAEFVVATVIGLGVAHFHEHLSARPHREPVEVRWYDSDELLELGDDAAVRSLVGKLTRAVPELSPAGKHADHAANQHRTATATATEPV
jgi:diadenosine tetraphosphate (Ap4A) HIT family hydrolase